MSAESGETDRVHVRINEDIRLLWALVIISRTLRRLGYDSRRHVLAMLRVLFPEGWQ